MDGVKADLKIAYSFQKLYKKQPSLIPKADNLDFRQLKWSENRACFLSEIGFCSFLNIRPFTAIHDG